MVPHFKRIHTSRAVRRNNYIRHPRMYWFKNISKNG